jgi:hypothetical protein
VDRANDIVAAIRPTRWSFHNTGSALRIAPLSSSKQDPRARALAEKFVQRFPRVAAECEGRDWAYAGWLLELTGLLERKPSRLPFVLAEYFEPNPLSMTALPLRVYGDLVGDDDGRDLSFPLPPPGYALR